MGPRETRPRRRRLGAVVWPWVGAALVTCACGGSGPETDPGPTQTPESTPPIPLVGSGDLSSNPGTEADRSLGHPLIWDTPEAFEEETPSSSMRRAQYRLPGPDGDGRCLVFYFGPGKGGPVDANLERWARQFTPEDGTPPLEAARREQGATSSGWPVTWIRTRGTYANPMAAEEPRDGYALLAAIVETPRGNGFFKCTGPEATMEAYEEVIRRWVRSVRTPSSSGP